MKYSVLSVLAMIFMLQISCSKSKDDAPSSADPLLGKWQLKRYEYTETRMDNSVIKKENGDFPADTYFEMQQNGKAIVKTNGTTTETSWKLIGQNTTSLLYLSPLLDSYYINKYFLMFPVGGFKVQEQTSSSLVLYLSESESNLLTRTQILYLQK